MSLCGIQWVLACAPAVTVRRGYPSREDCFRVGRGSFVQADSVVEPTA